MATKTGTATAARTAAENDPVREEAEVAAALVERIEAGDGDAEAAMVARYSQGLQYLLRHLTRNPTLSDDLHQETFRVVLERVRKGELRDPSKLSSFLRGTARNLVIASRRRSFRRDGEDLEDVREPADPAPGQLARLLAKEEVRLVGQVVAELASDRDRQVLYRFCVAEHDKEEICADLGLTGLQFNVVLFRARQRFKAQLAKLKRRLG